MGKKIISIASLTTIIGMLTFCISPAFAYPKPSAAKKSWNLDFSFQKPRAISVADKHGKKTWYWYMTYTVTNNSGNDQRLITDIDIANSNGRIIHAGEDIPVGLFKKIKKDLKDPLLKSPMDAVGKIRQGKDFAIESVAIWPAYKKNINSLTVFVAGLSGETATIKNPKTSKKIHLRRTCMIQFKLPGKHKIPQNQPVITESTSDIMR